MTLIIQTEQESIIFTLTHVRTRIFGYRIGSKCFYEETPYPSKTTLDQLVKFYLGYSINQFQQFNDPNDEMLFLLQYLSPNKIITLDF